MMKTGRLKAKDGLALAMAIFECEEPKAIVQIIHGAKEHKERYYDFCQFLCNHGYTVVISDNRGHGASVNEKYPLGYMDDVEQMVEDQYRITRFIKKQYPEKKLYLFGHSLGSIFARVYLQKHDDEIDKLVLSGSPNFHGAARYADILCFFMETFLGKKKHNPLMIKAGDNDDNGWVVKNEEMLDRYRKDPLCCGYKYYNAGITTIWRADGELKKFKKYQVKNPNLHILMISGAEDPVTGGDEGLFDTYQTLHQIGYPYVRVRVYEDMKHEVLNETGHEYVYEDVLEYLDF